MYENYDDVIRQLTDFGLLVGNLVKTDSLRPVRCIADSSRWGGRKNEKKGWYHLASFYVENKQYIVGAYGVWQGSDNNRQKIELGKIITLTPEQKKQQALQQKELQKAAKKAREEEIEKAAQRANYVWSKYVKDGHSDYLDRKQVKAHGVRFDPRGKGTIAVPIQGTNGKLYGLQLIRSDAAIKGTKKIQKKFEPAGLAITGHYHLIGSPTGVIIVVEGYATGATIHELTGLCVAVAYNANNLVPVSQNLKKHYPNAKIILAADDDYIQKCVFCKELTPVKTVECTHCGKPHGKHNAGVLKANEAANAVFGSVIVPNFLDAQQNDIRDGKKLTDFNDLALHPKGGPHLVRSQFETLLKTMPMAEKPQPKADNLPKGAGESYRARSVLSLDEIAERYILIEDGTGKTMFDTWSRNFVQHSMLERQMPAKATWNDLKTHHVWLSRALKKEQVAFDPTGKDPKIIENRWTGWPIVNPNHKDPENKCTKALALLSYLTSKEKCHDGDVFEWVIKWLAYPIQNPGAKMDSCLVFKGAQGTGKGFLFIQIFGALYGEFFASLTQSALEDKFNSDWSDRKLFIVADEVVASSEKYRYKNQLKTLISNPDVRVNPKNMSAYQERNHFNLVFLSNEAVPVILENDDRRHCVIETPSALPQNFYYELQDEVDKGGVEALYQYLLELDLGDFNARTKPPMTDSKEELINLGLDSHERFIKDWLRDETDFPVVPVSQKNFYKAYVKWANENGEHYRHSAKDLKPVLRKYGVNVKVTAAIYPNYKFENGSEKSTRMYEPSDIHLIASAEKTGTNNVRKHDKKLSEWRTEGNLAFEKILDERFQP